jgi:class 3 adenylate cyclase/predicted ATPase
VSTVAEWLASLGMSEYSKRFADNDIDESVLPDLSDQHLKDLGMSLGHRLKLLRAISQLAGNAPATPLPAARAEPKRETAERRQLTVMFCDLVGSTALSTRLDPEDLRAVIGAYHQCVAETVAHFDGFVAQYLGDGVLVHFGYPQAHEDDPERAVRAGLAILDAVRELRIGEVLEVRVGAASGLVVVGHLGSGEAEEKQGAVGETPNLAARLQAAAAPSTIVIDSTTRQLVAGLFEYRDLGDIEVKGFGRPVRAYQVLGPSAIESRFEALRTATIPLIGRDQEVELLLGRWQQAKAGHGCVVLVAGEPGIGKSRVAQTFLERLLVEPHTRLRYFCSPHHEDSPLYPIVAQLERAAGFRREDTVEQRLNKLETVLGQATEDLSQAAPLMADLLAIETGDRYPALNLTPKERKKKIFEALIAQIEGLAARQPLVMLFEDTHWSDPTTQELLDLLISRVPPLRLLVLITLRTKFPPPWTSSPQVTLLNLNRLAPPEQAEMIKHVIGGKTLPEEITDQIIDRTDGVPLFIEELTKSVIESGLVVQAGNQYALMAPVALAIPTTLHASLLARLDRLTPIREVAQIGAALGRRFSYELISGVAAIDKHQLDSALAQLVHAELIFRRGMPPDAEYTFKHALVQDAVYDTILRGRRQELHARIAMVLEERFPDVMKQQPQLLAQHCTLAGLVESAIRYWHQAGTQSARKSAMVEATAQLRRGLDLLQKLPERLEHRRQELELQSALGAALVASKGIAASETGQSYTRARELGEQLGDAAALVPILSGQISHHLGRAEYAKARHIAEDLLRLAEQKGDTAGQLVGHRSLGLCLHLIGDFTQAVAHFEQVLALYSPQTHQSLLSVAAYDMRALALTYLSFDLFMLGYPDQALSRDEQALSWSRQLGHPHTLLYALSIAGMVTQLRRAEQATEEALAEVFSLAVEHKLPIWLSSGNLMRGHLLTGRGEGANGLVLARNGMAEKIAQKSVLNQSYFLGLLAQTCAKAGETEEAFDLLMEALEIADRTDERWFEAELHRLKGDWIMAHHRGEQAEAEASFLRAITVAQKQDAKMWELRAATSLARLKRDQGKRSEAFDVLAPIYGWFTEGFHTPDLWDAKALLDELSAPQLVKGFVPHNQPRHHGKLAG